MWPNDRFINLCGIELPIIQAPMAGVAFSDMVVAISKAGGLGSLACALLSVEQARNELETIRRKTSRPINANFFCHQPPQDDRARERNWIQRLDAYYTELQADRNTSIPQSARTPFDEQMCDLVMEFHPEVVSFHFGLPDKNLLLRVRSARRRFYPLPLLSMRHVGLKIKDATQLSLRGLRPAGIEECFSRRLFLRSRHNGPGATGG